jgi:N-acetylglutamate synthase-like GNAT family acetyltransferase
MTINTRPATSEDINWLADLFAQSMRGAITAARDSWDVVREPTQFRAQLQIANTRVIRVDGDDVGFLTVHSLEDGLIEVHTLCVHPDRQGAGIGARIMRDVMTAAWTTRSAVELSVLKTNTRAEHFYARLGFAKIGASTRHIRMRWPVEDRD